MAVPNLDQLRIQVDEQLKVGRAPIRALTKVAAKARRAYDKAAKQAAQQGGNYPPAGVLGLASLPAEVVF